MHVVIGSDHAGFSLKEAVKGWFINWGVPCEDVGTRSEESCDYPDYAVPVAQRIAAGQAPRGCSSVAPALGWSLRPIVSLGFGLWPA